MMHPGTEPPKPPPPQQQQQQGPLQAPPPWPVMMPQPLPLPHPHPQQQQQQRLPAPPPPSSSMSIHQQAPPPPPYMMPTPQLHAGAELSPGYPAPLPPSNSSSSSAPSAGEVRTLWIGDLQYWMDENYIYSCFAHTGEVVSIKIIRNKQTMVSEGYGFIEFNSHGAAERILQTFNGALMPQTEQTFRLNWAAFGMSDRRSDGGSNQDHTIFVGDLAPDVSDYVLQETFRSRYPSVKGAKVVMDTITGRSKGYGFIRFGDENEKTRAMSEMNGAPAQGSNTDNDPNNSTVFVGGLDPNATDQDLRQVFGQFGELVSVKIPAGKGCGFVQFTHRACAEEAIQKLHGTVIGQQSVRLSWGRSPANKQSQAAGWGQGQPDPGQVNMGGYYGYGQGYESYGYAHPPQEGPAYAYPSYPGYGNYPQQTS